MLIPQLAAMPEVAENMENGNLSMQKSKEVFTMDDFNKELKEAIDRLDNNVDRLGTIIDRLSSICSLCIVSVDIVLIVLAAVLIFG